MKSNTKGGRTLNRPVVAKSVPNPEQTPAGAVADKYWPRPEAGEVASGMPGAETYKVPQPNSQGKTDMDLKTMVRTLPRNGR